MSGIYEPPTVLRPAADSGWRDQIGLIISPGSGPTIPTWSQIGATPFYAWKYALNDQQWVLLHIQHDYQPGTDIHLHAHWFTDGASLATVKWEFSAAYAKGHNQGAFNFASATVATAEEAASGTQYQHMITETAAQASALFEPDGVLMVRVRRITNGGTDNTDGVYSLFFDAHYQTDRAATLNKAPDFYG